MGNQSTEIMIGFPQAQKILSNLTVGDNVKVGANAVVVQNIPSDTVVVGVPARIIRRDGKRVSEEIGWQLLNREPIKQSRRKLLPETALNFWSLRYLKVF